MLYASIPFAGSCEISRVSANEECDSKEAFSLPNYVVVLHLEEELHGGSSAVLTKDFVRFSCKPFAAQ